MRGGIALAIAISVAAVGYARAQPSEERAQAERLFREGRELVRAGRWNDACPKFEESLRHERTRGTQINLANCYEHTAKVASALAAYRELIDDAEKAGDIDRLDFAREQVAAIAPRVPTLVVVWPA